MEMPGWRWMLLVLLLGGHRLETSGIAVLDGCFRDGKRQGSAESHLLWPCPRPCSRFARLDLDGIWKPELPCQALDLTQ